MGERTVRLIQYDTISTMRETTEIHFPDYSFTIHTLDADFHLQLEKWIPSPIRNPKESDEEFKVRENHANMIQSIAMIVESLAEGQFGFEVHLDDCQTRQEYYEHIFAELNAFGFGAKHFGHFTRVITKFNDFTSEDIEKAADSFLSETA